MIGEVQKLEVKILDPRIGRDIELPRRATSGSPGLTCAPASTRRSTSARRVALVPTGIAIHLGDPSLAAISCRARLGHKHGIVLGNLVGLIDSDYQCQVMVSMWNRGGSP